MPILTYETSNHDVNVPRQEGRFGPSLNWGKPCEASQFSRVRCDLAETHGASGALMSERNIDTIRLFLVCMNLHKSSNQLVLEYGIHVRFI